jgi:glycosyltransferase involved in cell wall biosynthesis
MTIYQFLCPNLQAGGAERHWSLLLPALRERGLDARVVTLDGRGQFFDSLVDAGVPCAFLETGSRGYRHAAGMLLRHSADVIVTRGTSAHVLGRACAQHRRVRWVVNWHRPGGLTLTARRRTMLRAILPASDGVIAVSADQLDGIRALGVSSRAISVIPNGVPVSSPTRSRSAVRDELAVGDDDILVLLVGRLEPQKRVDLFIDALCRCHHDDRPVIGAVVGSGPLRDELARQANTSGSPVRFLGRRDDVPDLMAAADLLCVSSDSEAMPFSVLEAMSSALPVVGTAVGALSEILGDGGGVLVAPGDACALSDAISALAASDDRRQELGRAALARQRREYSADAMADRYASALRSVTGHSALVG